MYKRSLIFAALALALASKGTPALANVSTDDHVGAGIHDVSDQELSTMRGRYIVGDNTIMWFGVEMITTMQTSSGQVVQGTLTLGMNFAKNPNSPGVTFVPTVTITTPDAPLPTTATVQSAANRNVQSGGIANVGGLVQSVQIAGDNNATANVTSLNIQSGGNASTSSNTVTTGTSTSTSPSGASITNSGTLADTHSSAINASTTHSASNDNTGSNNSTTLAGTTNTGSNTSNGRSATVDDATASSTYSGDSAGVTVSVAGQGSASQWIHPGSLGQTIALTTDNAIVTNQMIVSLVTQQLSSTAQLAHTLAQSLNLSHLNGH